ncbi:MAG: penicillin-binding protein activator LpoB [Balneolaceae bacterium]
MKHSIFLFLLFAALITACEPTQKITRIDPGTTTDLSGRWNDTDARLVADKMIGDALTKPWLNQFSRSHQQAPVVIVGRVRNETMEHIDSEVFTKEMERAFVNSGSVSVVASRSEREDVRDERLDQQTFASYETTKKMAQELGADFMMIGNISSIVDETVNRKHVVIFYTINLEFINVETNQKVWIGNEKIKKLIDRKNYRG